MPLPTDNEQIVFGLYKLNLFIKNNESVELLKFSEDDKIKVLNDLLHSTKSLLDLKMRLEEGKDDGRFELLDLFTDKKKGWRQELKKKFDGDIKKTTANNAESEIEKLAQRLKLNQHLPLPLDKENTARYINLCMAFMSKPIESLSRYAFINKLLDKTSLNKTDALTLILKESANQLGSTSYDSLLFSDLAKITHWGNTKAALSKQFKAHPSPLTTQQTSLPDEPAKITSASALPVDDFFSKTNQITEMKNDAADPSIQSIVLPKEKEELGQNDSPIENTDLTLAPQSMSESLIVQHPVPAKPSESASPNGQLDPLNATLNALQLNLHKKESDIEDLRKEKNRLQASFDAQQKFYQDDLNNKKATEARLLDEINKLNTELNLTKNEYALSKEEIAKISNALEEKTNKLSQLMTRQSESDGLLDSKHNEYQTLSAEQLSLKLKLQQKDSLLQEQQNALEQIKYDLKNKEKLSKQLNEEIKVKNKQSEDVQQQLLTLNKNLQGKQSEFQHATYQINELSQQLKTAQEAEKVLNSELNVNTLQIQHFQEQIKKLNLLSEQLDQEKEKNKVLSIKLHSEKNDGEKLSPQLKGLHQEINKFVRAVKSDLKKTNPTPSIIEEEQHFTELGISEKTRQLLGSPIQHYLAITDDEGSDDDDNLMLEHLDRLKQEISLNLNSLRNQAEIKEQQLALSKENTIKKLQKELRKAEEKIDTLTRVVERINHDQDEDEDNKSFIYDDIPINSDPIDDDDIDNQLGHTPEQYLDNILNNFPEVARLKSELKEQSQKFSRQLSKKEAEIQGLTVELYQNNADLKIFAEKINQLNSDKEESQQDKLHLTTEIGSLAKKNAALHALIDQASVATNQTTLIENEIDALDEKQTISQKDDGHLKKNYATLEKNLAEKNSELNLAQIELTHIKEQLEAVGIKNITTQGGLAMPENQASTINNLESLGEDQRDQSHNNTLINDPVSTLLEENPSSGSSTEDSCFSSQDSITELNDSIASNSDEGFLEPTSSETSTHSPGSTLHRSRSLSDLQKKSNVSSATIDKSQLINPFILNNPEALTNQASPPAAITSGHDTAPLSLLRQEQAETPMEQPLFSSKESRQALIAELATVFADRYKQAFLSSSHTLNDSPLTRSLVNLESEQSKRLALAHDTCAHLLRYPAEIKASFLSLKNQPLPDAVTSVQDLVTAWINTPCDQNSVDLPCAQLLQAALEKNRTNALTLRNHAESVMGTFKENYKEISPALTEEFSRIASASAILLFNGPNIELSFPGFQDELQKKSNLTIKRLFADSSNQVLFLYLVIEEINKKGLTQPSYLEAIKKLSSFILRAFRVKEIETGEEIEKMPCNQYAAHIARNLLIARCINDLQTKEKAPLINEARNALTSKMTAYHLNASDYAETIQTAPEQLVSTLLETSQLQSIILNSQENNCTANLNLLEASKDKLQTQLLQHIELNVDSYFPNLYFDPILEKINHNNALPDRDKLSIDVLLTEDEKQRLPSGLQYAHSKKEFAAGLRIQHTYLHANYEHKLDDNTFKLLRSIPRKKALAAIKPQTLINENDVINLDPEAWLATKLHVVTEKSLGLKLDTKKQKDLDSRFNQLFPLSLFDDMAVTHKSADELADELKKLHYLKTEITHTLYRTFSEIENKLTQYPHLIEVNAFTYCLNRKLSEKFPEDKEKWTINEEEIKILLEAISRRLEKNSGKWSLFNPINDKKCMEEIAHTIYANTTLYNRFNEVDDIKKLVTTSLEVAHQVTHLADKLDEREKWKTDIQQLSALADKLRSLRKRWDIRDRKSIFEAMQNLKQTDPEGIYLPHKCKILPSTAPSDPSETNEYTVLQDGFYKQGALNVGQTITFAQTLSNESECKWSVTRSNEQSLTYKTQKKFFRREKDYVQEISFTQMIHSVNSFKNAKICTLSFGHCSTDMKEKLYLFAHAYNELHHENNVLKGRPRILCHMKNPPDLNKAEIAEVKDEIKAKLNLATMELSDISATLKNGSIGHEVTRSRG